MGFLCTIIVYNWEVIFLKDSNFFLNYLKMMFTKQIILKTIVIKNEEIG